MSSSTGNTTYKLKIYRSDTGSVYEIPVNSPSILIETIKESIQSITNLTPSEQILLADTNLFSNRTLESYGITKDKEIYLFNKRIIENPNLKPEEVEISIGDLLNLPKIPTSKNIRELEVSNNAINRLTALDIHLRNQFLQIQYIKETFDKKLIQCQNLNFEIIVQKKSILFALDNFKEYREKLVKSHSNFTQNFNKVSSSCESLLKSFENDMNRLKQIKLHESHRSSHRSTLADCIPEFEIRKWSEQAKKEYEITRSKITEIEFQVTAVNDAVDYEFKKMPSLANSDEFADRVKVVIDHCKQLQSFMMSFSNNSEKIKRFLDQMNRNMVDPNQVAQVIMSFSEIRSQQESTLTNMTMNSEAIKSITMIAKTKNYMSNYSFDVLRNISRLQDKIRNIGSSYPVWQEAVNKLQGTFMQLEIIHRFPTTYEESINETLRRKKFGVSLVNSFNRFVDSLNTIREEENQKRLKYIDQYLIFMPNNNTLPFQSLKELLPKFLVNLPEFDILLNQSLQSSNFNFNSTATGSGDDDEEFTVIEGMNNDYFVSGSSGGSGGSANSISNSKKYQMELEKSLSELKLQESQKIKVLESKLQSTFLLASKTDEKYKDLLEKTKMASQSNLIDKSMILDSQQKIDLLKSSLEDKKSLVDKLTSDILKLTEEASQSVQKIESLQTNQVIYDDKIQKYTELIQRLESESEEMRTKIRELNSSLESAMKESDESKEGSDNLIKELKNTVQSKEEKIQEISEELELVQQLKLESESKIESLNMKLDKGLTDSNVLVSDLRQELKALRDELESSKREASNLVHESKLAKEKSELAKTKGEEEVKVLSDKIKQLQLLLGEKDGVFEDSKTKIQELQDELFVSSEKLQQLENALEEKTAQFNEKISAFQDENQVLKDSITKFKSDYEVLKDKVGEFEEENQVIKEQNKFLEISAEKKEQKIKMLAEQLEKSEVALVEINSKSQVLDFSSNKKIKDMEDIIKDQSNQLQQSAIQISNKDSMNQELSVIVKNLEDTIFKQTQQISDLDTELIRRDQHLNEKNQNTSSSQHVIASQQEELMTLRKKLSDLESVAQISQTQNQSLQLESQKNSKIIKELQDQITALSSLKEYETLVRQISSKISDSQGILDRNTITKFIQDSSGYKESCVLLERNLQAQAKEVDSLRKRCEELENAYQEKPVNNDNNALLYDFTHSRNAVFLPNQDGHYEAININAPRFFLSEFSKEEFTKEIKSKAPVIGIIFEIETKLAGQNSYGLIPGTEFHEVLIGRINQ